MPVKNNQESVTTSYVWDIGNFAYLVMLAEPGYSIRSTNFSLSSSNDAWDFHIYPNGKSCKNYISFYLSKPTPSNQNIHHCTLSIGKPDATPVKSYKYINIRFRNNVVGEDFFLLKKPNSWILKGPVRFRCDITEIGHRNQNFTFVSFTPFPFHLDRSYHFGIPDIDNLSRNLEELLTEPFHSDLTVNINGSEMYIHKYILFARCPNLSFEFGYRTIMEMPPCVEIQISEVLFEFLMHYIYTGKLRDSHIPLELLRYAERLGLLSLIECVHEHAYSYHIYSEVDIANQIISWNLDELEEGLNSVHILRTKTLLEKLAVQVSVSDGCGNEKFVHISMNIFRVQKRRPIALVCKISLTSQAGLEAFREESHVFSKVEQWDFPRLPYLKGKQNLCLTAELNISESNMAKRKWFENKIKLYTDFQTVTESLEFLRSSMAFLFQMSKNTSNLVLLSADNTFFRVHDGILWARWPGLRRLLEESSVSSDDEMTADASQLELHLPSEVLNILLQYLYTGFISNFDREKAKNLLKYSNYPKYPYRLVEKCKVLLSNSHQNQL